MAVNYPDKDKRIKQLEEAFNKALQSGNFSVAGDIKSELDTLLDEKDDSFRVPLSDEDREYDQHFAEQKARMDKQVNRILPNEPAKSPSALSGEQAKASQTPSADTSAESLRPKSLYERAINIARRGKGRGNAGPAANVQGGFNKAAQRLGGANAGFKQGLNKLKANLAKKLAKEAIKKAALALVANPYFWIIVVAILAILFVMVIAFSFLGMAGGGNASHLGKTQNRPADPVKDAGVIQQFSKMSGNKASLDTKINQTLEKNQLDLVDMKNQTRTLPNAAAISQQVDITLGVLDILKADKTQENATKYLDETKKLMALFENNFPAYPTDRPTRIPLINTALTFNTELHGGSYGGSPTDHIPHIDNHGTYTAYDQGLCDATDLSAAKGDSVFPIFGGSIIEKSSDGLDGEKLVISDNSGYSILYAHLVDIPVKVGDTVTINDQIGAVKDNNLQLEVIYNDKCLVTTSADALDHKQTNRKHEEWGGYLWDHIKEKFNIKVQ